MELVLFERLSVQRVVGVDLDPPALEVWPEAELELKPCGGRTL